MPDEGCTHIGAIATVKHRRRYECDECVKIGSEWVHLRTCQECGVTLCCDNSPNRHATAHYHAETGGFFGYYLARVLPYNLARTWHLQLGLFWVVASFLAAGIFLAPVISGAAPAVANSSGVGSSAIGSTPPSGCRAPRSANMPGCR